ncbi:MAG: 4-hydroxythreonine-4-phosphate dehydrogenase PdxA [Deltaproteobacteria bacterium CG03_land_8_20_14_0_80_45_14]|nr:MAG: 4-hydroxythreonine-4-phosphate dehydrogenase PdxA [Deltaproteobacteria bacterium CG03_land_8_20_14_0_80_45_14]
MTLPKIGITMGDPTGIGPEIIVKALSMKEPFEACRPIVFGDRAVLSKAIQMQNLSTTLEVIEKIPENGYLPQKIFLHPFSRLEVTSLRFGQPDRACGEAMVKYIEEAVKWVRSGKLDAITTCPINKQAMNAAGYFFPGHTELLAHLVGASSVAMMFLGSRWKIVLVTTHLPLKDVSRWITTNRILSTIRLTDEGMKEYLGIPHPKIAVLGLNPHCGEGGLLGEEEKKEILPAIAEAKSLGMDVEGPFPADSFFDLSGRCDFHVVVSMYHDQGLIPIKMLDFKEAVNFTLGLPFIRTSVDHGTAYDIAGKGLADPSNLVKAILTAANLSKLKINY